MLSLENIKDLIKTLDSGAERFYVGVLSAKNQKSIGVYARDGTGPEPVPIGGRSLRSYSEKPVSILIHWNNNPVETERSANRIFKSLYEVRNVQVADQEVIYVRMDCTEPIDVGPDNTGICERVIRATFIYKEV